METKKKYIPLKDLEVYKLARELSKIGWQIYKPMDWQTRKIVGDQFIRAVDSFGANIAEGYGRYHYLDRIKFFYTARASIVEAVEHWLELLKERELVEEEDYSSMVEIKAKALLKLQNLIAAIYRVRASNN